MYVYCVYIMENEKNIYAISSGVDKIIKIWNVNSLDTIKTLKGHNHSVFSFSMNEYYNSIFSGSFDHTIKMWKVKNGNQIKTFIGHTSWIFCIKLSRN